MWFGIARWFIFVFALLFVQISLLRVFGGLSLIVPNLLLVIVVYLGFYRINLAGLLASFGLGLLFDIASGGLLGPWSAAFVLVYCLVVTCSQRLFPDATLAIVLIGGASSMIATTLYITIFSLVSPTNQTVPVLGSWLIVEAIVTGCSAPLVMLLCRKITRQEN